MNSRPLVTQIGSLPFKNIEQAIKYSLKHGIPFLPELPRLGDSMLDYIKHPGQLSCLSAFCRHRFATVKIQCIGPATLILSGCSEDEAMEKICAHISAILAELKANEVILFLDEPALGQAGFNFQDLWDSIFKNFKVTPGVHCCGNMDWDILLKSPIIEIISFDASQFDITKYPYYLRTRESCVCQRANGGSRCGIPLHGQARRSERKKEDIIGLPVELHRNGKKIAWGIESADDVKDFRIGDLITPTCGLGPSKYSVNDCYQMLKKLRRIVRGLSSRQ